jgi:hypothetical protein
MYGDLNHLVYDLYVFLSHSAGHGGVCHYRRGMNELLEMRCDIMLFFNVFTKRAFVLCDYFRVFVV